MRSISRIVIFTALVLTAPVLSGCADFDIDKLDILGLNEKKKLPGDRKPVFPEGVPGVTQGIPPEYIKGNQPPQDTAMAPAAAPEANTPPAAAAAPQLAKQSATVDPNDEPKPKIRKPKVAKQKLIPDQSPKPAQTQQQQDQQQPPQQSSTAPWPAAPQTGTFSR